MTPPPLEPNHQAAPERTVADVPCTACGCLCDDVVLQVSGNRITTARNACERGQAWFLADHSPADLPDAIINGQPASVEEALDRAVEILTSARAPVVLGLTETTTEAQSAAIALADRLGAVIVPSRAAGSAGHVRAVQRVGRVSATLGEVKNRADVVVFWGADPVTTHPRHWERYSVEPRGRFVPAGRADRTVLVVDSHRTATADRADQFLRVPAEQWLPALWALRAVANGVVLDAQAIERATGLTADTIRDWAARLAGARYGAFFLGPALASVEQVEAALLLVRELNARGRFVALTLGEPGNAAGAAAALTWQTGCPLGADFRLGYPRDPFGEGSATGLLEDGRADAALIVADHVAAGPHGPRIPTVIVAPDGTAAGRGATVGFASATYGIHAPGTVMRCDGVALPLRPALATHRLTDRQLLGKMAERLASLRAQETGHGHA